jgi:2'-5' RNA ligase
VLKSTRAFIALPIPEPTARNLSDLQAALARQVSGVRWVGQAGFHVTLNFLGDVPDSDLGLICQSVADAAKRIDSFEASVEGVGAFPDPRRPRVIWAGTGAGRDSLARLFHELEGALTAIGYPSDEPRFHPHVTLGRIKAGRGPAPDLTGVVESRRAWSGGCFPARELVVYASKLGPAGPVYTPLGRAPLGGGSGLP